MLLTLKNLFQVLDTNDRKLLYSVLMFLFFIGIFEILGIASIIPIISIMSDPAILDTNKYLFAFKKIATDLGYGRPQEILILLGFSSFSMIALATALRSIGVYVTTKFIEMRRHYLSHKLLSGYLRNDYEFFLNSQSAEITKIVLSEIDRIVAQLIRPLVMMVSYMFLLIFVLTFLFFVNPQVSMIIILIFGGLYSFVYFLIRWKVNYLGVQTVQSNRERFALTMEALKNIKYIKYRGLEDYYIRKFFIASYQFSHSVAVQFVLNQIPKYIVELVAFGGLILVSVLTLISNSELNGSVSSSFFPMLSAYALSAYKLQPAVQSMFNGIVSLRYGRATLDNLFKSLDQINPSGNPNGLEKSNVEVIFDQEFESRGISFKYANEKSNIVENINFKIPRGSSVGIIGKTGSGKSTLISLILGLLRPNTGSFLVDGKEINEITMRKWQNIIGYVPQDVTLIDATIFENIAFGSELKDIDSEHAINCGRIAMIDESFFSNTNQKYIGDDGVKISGGQKQRIGIARALYKRPSLLVLDEATSGLDPKTEKQVLDNISKYSKCMSILMITHKYKNLGICDEVYELQDGHLRKCQRNIE